MTAKGALVTGRRVINADELPGEATALLEHRYQASTGHPRQAAARQARRYHASCCYPVHRGPFRCQEPTLHTPRDPVGHCGLARKWRCPPAARPGIPRPDSQHKTGVRSPGTGIVDRCPHPGVDNDPPSPKTRSTAPGKPATPGYMSHIERVSGRSNWPTGSRNSYIELGGPCRGTARMPVHHSPVTGGSCAGYAAGSTASTLTVAPGGASGTRVPTTPDDRLPAPRRPG
jgi:hypothetical protein